MLSLARTVLILSCNQYDIDDGNCLYDGEREQTFREAMQQRGYSSLFFHSPHQDKFPDLTGAGLYLAWNQSTFELQQPYDCATVPIGSHAAGAVKNVDLHERRLVRGHDSQEATAQDMKIDDRRHFGVVHLRHKPTGKTLMVVITHLMTDSRDNQKTNLFTGEVRANELSTIRECVQTERLQRACDAVIFTGDFNISLAKQPEDDELHVLRGRLQCPDKTLSLDVPTGFEVQAESGCGLLHWPRERPLREAFEDVHKWGERVGNGAEGVCSSFSSKRCNWIDFMFYSADSLELKKVSLNKTPPHHLPAPHYPSDHLPISAMFEFRKL